MNWDLTEEQAAVREAAAAVFEGHATLERVREVERSPDRFDRALWGELARTNLLAIALPEDAGGSGLGMVELCLVLEQQGRRVAPVPVWEALVCAAPAIARFGSEEQRRRWLPALGAGDVVLTAAFDAAVTGDARLTGTLRCVPGAHVADRVVVPTATGVVLVDPTGPGVTLERAETTNRQLVSHLELDGAPAERLAGPEAVPWVRERALTGLCAIQVGVCEEAVRMTADYVSERRQFGRPLSSFQGVALRAADAHIDTEAMRVTMLHAAWRLDAGLDATAAVRVAAWWAADGGHRVVHAAQHLHGGIGADVEYPVHRYFLWGKQLAGMMGGPSEQLAHLGHVVAGLAHR